MKLKNFIEKSNKIHNNFYNYEKVNYVDCKTKIEIICPIHGSFWQRPINHLKGYKCKKCACKKENKYDNNSFAEKCSKIHNGKYDYSQMNYINIKNPIEIICPVHGSFYQLAYVHLQGHGCKKCLSEENSNRFKNKNFITISEKIHDNKYDYSLVKYINNKTKIKIICPKHGVFEQIPSSHLKGHGCPICRNSKGEKIIRKYLNENKIDFISQKRFTECRYKLPLPFDFYLPKYNCCIEYDGEMHYGIKMHFDYDKDIIKKRDEIKTQYCKNNNIELFRISYKDDIKSEMMKLFYIFLNN